MFGFVRRIFAAPTECAVLRARLSEQALRLAQSEAERDYWRSRTELLLDAALFKRGEVTHHVFSTPPKPTIEKAMSNIFGPLAVTEIGRAPRREAAEDGV